MILSGTSSSRISILLSSMDLVLSFVERFEIRRYSGISTVSSTISTSVDRKSSAVTLDFDG